MSVRRSVVLGLLAALLLCPLMAVAAALPAEASCHQPPEPNHTAAFDCCEGVVAAAKAAFDTPALPAPVDTERPLTAPVLRGTVPADRPGALPLFLRHLSLRI